jgi:hypothetical protein
MLRIVVWEILTGVSDVFIASIIRAMSKGFDDGGSKHPTDRHQPEI